MKGEKLKYLLQDTALLDAVKALFQDAVEQHRPDIPILGSDELLGQSYRAYVTAKTIVDTAFTNLENYRTLEGDKPQELSPL